MGNRALSQELIELGNRIRDRRQELRLSQETLAEKAGISTNTVGRMEGGQTAVSIEVFMSVAQALEVDANTLLGGMVPARQESGRMKEILCKVSRLKRREQKVVLQTMKTLIDGLHDCK